MRIETLLNKVHPLKSFVYAACRLDLRKAGLVLVATIKPRKNGKIVCSGCGKPRRLYDRLDERRFDFVPLWNIPVQLEYRMRRVHCPECGVKIEQVPWADGKSPTTKAFQLFLARWARKLSWKETAESFCTSWDTVFRSVKVVVAYGLAHRNLENVTAIGVDEIQYGKGHQYLTVVYQIDAGARRLLFVGRDRTAKPLLKIFRQFGKERCGRLRFVCSDMWKAYLKVIRKKAPQALHVLDRFHIVGHLNKAKKAYSSGVVEGLNRKVNLVTRKAFGFRSYDVLEIALFHTMGDLPEPELTHRFC